MPWAKLDDDFHDHPKLIAAGVIATGIQARAISYCADLLTDGHISEGALPGLLTGLNGTPPPEGPDWPTYMVATGLWDRTARGYRVHDYLDYNPTKKEIESRRRLQAKSGRIGAQRRWEPEKTPIAKPMGSPMGDPMTIRHAPDPTRPAPEGSGVSTPVVMTTVSGVDTPLPPAPTGLPAGGPNTGPIVFEDFWRHYPTNQRGKVGKGAARKVWGRIKPSVALAARILSAVVEQRTWPEWQRENGRFIPNASKWLDREGWNDEPPGSPTESVIDPEVERRRVQALLGELTSKLSLPPAEKAKP